MVSSMFLHLIDMGDVNTFIVKLELYIQLKMLEGEDAAMMLASVYMRLSLPTLTSFLNI